MWRSEADWRSEIFLIPHRLAADHGDHRLRLPLREHCPLVSRTHRPALIFRGGLELLFAHKRSFAFSLPKRFGQPSKHANINFLIKQLGEREMKDPRRDLFIKDDTVYSLR